MRWFESPIILPEATQLHALSPVLLTILALSVLFVVAATLVVRRWLVRLVRQRRARRAGIGERRGARLLERAGYRVLEAQAVRAWPVQFGQRRVLLQLRVDYLAERGGKLFVADAKTGELATSDHSSATRRQLLEYLIAYQAHGALLVDMHRQRIVEVTFPDFVNR